MLKIVIKAYSVNVLVDIRPIYLNKHYLFENKIYDLDKIYKLNQLPGQLKNIYFMQAITKMRHVLGRSVRKCASFLKYVVLQFQFPKLWLFVTSSKSKCSTTVLADGKIVNQLLQKNSLTILQQLLAKPSENCCCSLFSEAATGGFL